MVTHKIQGSPLTKLTNTKHKSVSQNGNGEYNKTNLNDEKTLITKNSKIFGYLNIFMNNIYE